MGLLDTGSTTPLLPGTVATVTAAQISDATAAGRAMVQAADATAQRGLLRTYSWPVAGSVVDYTVAANYAPAGLAADGVTAASDQLGDGTTTPHFHALYTGRIASLARGAAGLTLTHDVSSSAAAGQFSWPHTATAGTALVIPLDVSSDVQIDARIVTNVDAYRSTGTDYAEAAFSVARWSATAALPERPAFVWWSSYVTNFAGAITEIATTNAAPGTTGATGDAGRNVSSAPEGTTAFVTSRDVRIILRGLVVEVLTGPAGGALTRRVYRADPRWHGSRHDLAVVLAVMQSHGVPVAGLFARIASLSVTPL